MLSIWVQILALMKKKAIVRIAYRNKKVVWEYGWVSGCMGGKAVLRIAYSNQKLFQ